MLIIYNWILGVTLKFMKSLTQQTLCGHIFTGRHYLDPIVTLKAEYKFLWLVTGNMANRQNYDDITIMREVNHYTDILYKIYKHHQEVMSTNRYYQNIPDDVPTESIVTGVDNGYNGDSQGIQKKWCFLQDQEYNQSVTTTSYNDPDSYLNHTQNHCQKTKYVLMIPLTPLK